MWSVDANNNHILFEKMVNKIKNLEVSNPNKCLEKFKSNNLLGLIVFINILIGKII